MIIDNFCVEDLENIKHSITVTCVVNHMRKLFVKLYSPIVKNTN